jgi:hypothetical protein
MDRVTEEAPFERRKIPAGKTIEDSYVEIESTPTYPHLFFTDAAANSWLRTIEGDLRQVRDGWWRSLWSDSVMARKRRDRRAERTMEAARSLADSLTKLDLCDSDIVAYMRRTIAATAPDATAESSEELDRFLAEALKRRDAAGLSGELSKASREAPPEGGL